MENNKQIDEKDFGTGWSATIIVPRVAHFIFPVILFCIMLVSCKQKVYVDYDNAKYKRVDVDSTHTWFVRKGVFDDSVLDGSATSGSLKYKFPPVKIDYDSTIHF